MNASERPAKAPSTSRSVVIAVVAVAITALVMQVAPALAQGRSAPTAVRAAKTTVYQAKIVNAQSVLGPQSSPTLLASTQVLPAGTYVVTAIVAAVIYPHDQIVCAVNNVLGENDGVFGTAGNPADGTAGVYGTATLTDTLKVSKGQRLYLGCNSFNFGKGTYAAEAILEAIPANVHG